VALASARALDAGGFQEESDGCYIWGLTLRLGANVPAESIVHLPFIVSHRAVGARVPTPLAEAHVRRLQRAGEDADVVAVWDGVYRVRRRARAALPRVSVVVPSRCEPAVLRPCVEGLLGRTAYPSLEVAIVANGPRRSARDVQEFLSTFGQQPQVRILEYDERPYNFSKTNNFAVRHTDSDFLCFLNDDTVVINRNWLAEMVICGLEERVAAVGAMLFYPNGRIQHAGVVVGAGTVAAHSYSRERKGTRGYHDRALLDQDASCVTAACILVRRDAFDDVGGFDDALAIAFNDVDFCLR